MNQKLQDRIRNCLERSAGNLPASDLSRLNQARQRALEDAASRRRRGWPVAAAVAFVMALGVATALWLDRPAPAGTPVATDPATPLADLDLLSGEEELEMLADLEFYLWLEENWAEDAG